MISEYTEKYIEQKLVEKVKKLGGRAYKFVSPGNIGVPDRLVVLPENKVGFVEVKRQNGRLSKLQKNQLEFLKSLGCKTFVLWNINEIDQIIEKIQKGSRKWE